MTHLPTFPNHKLKVFLSLVVASALGIALPLSPAFNITVYAGTFQSAKVTISDSRAAATGVTYDFAVTATVTTAIKQADIQFCTTPTGTCTAPTGMSTGTPTLASDNLAGTGRTTSAPTANAIRVVVTTPATQSTQAITMSFSGLTNSSTINTSFFARLVSYSDTGTTVIDSVDMGFAILTTTSLAVTAQVGSTFTFTIAPATSGSVNGATITVADTAAGTIPFGVLTGGSPKIAAHDLSIVTNSNNGYAITTKTLTDPPLQDGSNDIDTFTGTNASPATWSSPGGTTKNVNTGFFGYTTNDATLGTGTADRFTSSGGNKWAGNTTSPLEVAYNATAVSSAQTTRVGWQSEINGIQPPGNYSGTVILVATPTY